MYKKTITYTDYNGVERKEDHYFNLSKAELVMMNLSEVGGLRAKMEKMISDQNSPAIMSTFHDILRQSYGEKSADGRQFIKSDELFRSFEQTEAFSQFFMELCTNSATAAEFINGVLPKDLAEAVAKANINADNVISIGDSQ